MILKLQQECLFGLGLFFFDMTIPNMPFLVFFICPDKKSKRLPLWWMCMLDFWYYSSNDRHSCIVWCSITIVDNSQQYTMLQWKLNVSLVFMLMSQRSHCSIFGHTQQYPTAGRLPLDGVTGSCFRTGEDALLGKQILTLILYLPSPVMLGRCFLCTTPSRSIWRATGNHDWHIGHSCSRRSWWRLTYWTLLLLKILMAGGNYPHMRWKIEHLLCLCSCQNFVWYKRIALEPFWCEGTILK